MRKNAIFIARFCRLWLYQFIVHKNSNDENETDKKKKPQLKWYFPEIKQKMQFAAMFLLSGHLCLETGFVYVLNKKTNKQTIQKYPHIIAYSFMSNNLIKWFHICGGGGGGVGYLELLWSKSISVALPRAT